MIKIKYSILTGLLFAIIMFIYLVITAKMDVAIVVAIFVFLVSPFLAYLKIFSKVDFTTKFEKINKKLVIYSGMANHSFEGVSAGGTLYLLNDKLIFQTNSMSFIKRHQTILFLNQIDTIDFVNTMGLIGNGLLINTKSNKKEQFVVNNRIIWKEKIQEILK